METFDCISYKLLVENKLHADGLSLSDYMVYIFYHLH